MTTPEQSYSTQDIHDAWGISPHQIRKLIASGRVGYIRAGRSKRFLPEHIAQLRACIEVQPKPTAINGVVIEGLTERGASRRRAS